MQTDKIYRFKFSNEIVEILDTFSKLYKHTCQKEYKEKWDEWLIENKQEIDKESERLLALGYEGNIKEKMYKSARYYFRKKSEEKKEPTDQIVSDEEESVSSVDINAEQRPTTVEDAEKSSFPFGKIASHKAVKGRPNVFLNQKPSREDEEKSLADMVMKGYSKYEIFTGESEID